MMRVAFIFILLQSCLFAYPRVSPDLAEAVSLIYRFPDSRTVLEKVEQQGQISIYSAPFQSTSGAMWVPDERAIVINTRTKKTFGEITRSILFELHNAYYSKEFDHLDDLATWNKISKHDYIVAVEYREHQNAIMTKRLVDKAISQNYFPRDSYWEVPSDFRQHLEMQQYCGHSAAIGGLYDSICRR